jgi:hypothetical protein
VKVTFDDCSPDRLQLLQTAILRYPGNQPVIFKLSDQSIGVKRYQLGDQYRVTDNPTLRNQIFNIMKPRIVKTESTIWDNMALTRNSF